MQRLIFFLLMGLHNPLFANEELIPDNFTWGIYCGECSENCSTLWKIDKTSLKIDESNNFFEADPFRYQFNGKPETKEKHSDYNWVLDNPIPPILDQKKIVFGQPDAYDQCGYYIAYEVDERKYQALIDPNEVPKELKTMIGRLFN